ncbi:MAG: trypsin-like peptidase domain-containing protein, partial [Verrucomicrobiota bacterium]
MTLKLFLQSVLCLALVSSVACAEKPEFKINVDDRPVTTEGDEPVVTYANVLEQATPSVVAVYTARIVTTPPGGAHPGMPELFRQFGLPVPQERNGDEPVERRQRLGVGSGVIVSENGYIVTNHHVVTDQRGSQVDEIRVRLPDNQEYVAELVGSDEKT